MVIMLRVYWSIWRFPKKISDLPQSMISFTVHYGGRLIRFLERFEKEVEASSALTMRTD